MFNYIVVYYNHKGQLVTRQVRSNSFGMAELSINEIEIDGFEIMIITKQK